MSSPPSRISPTAHYTGHVWLENGLSDPAFAKREGERLHMLLAPFMAGSSALGGPTIDRMLLARHHLIDQRLERAIEDGRASAGARAGIVLQAQSKAPANGVNDRARRSEVTVPYPRV